MEQPFFSIKTAEVQIVLGLLVSQDGYPLSYSIFNGKQYKGYITNTDMEADKVIAEYNGLWAVDILKRYF
ncbi:hypothetical protein LJC06_01095 [Bacteroidales bacterium OttesenSCG-928-I14]|nr:hypothetical protein [Bacteroidales bacterium OttesenSCG-928-I14]